MADDDISLDSDSSDSRPTRRSVKDSTPTIVTRSSLHKDPSDSDASDSRPTTRLKASLKDATLSDVARLTLDSNKILENFNPETSVRERRKLNRKLNPGTNKKVVGAIFDENGAYISSGQNLCDCLFPGCLGCFLPCPKCNSDKCGSECRVNRRYMYDSVDIEGRSKSYRNTHGK